MATGNMNVTPDVQLLPAARELFNYADPTSQLDLEDWVSILTLCFSPLIAHIIAGVPTVVRRCPKPPSWLDTLCLYNPTTILWRYLAIADRRARLTRTWNAADMAASNAVFWTSEGFDGSEEMMYKSRAFCSRTSALSHAEIFSTDTIKTVITTLQGIQACFVIIRGILALATDGHHPFSATMAMDSIFYPLAIFGLLRLFAAPWLTERYTYTEHDVYETSMQLAPAPSSHTSLSYPMPPSALDTEAGTKHPDTIVNSNTFTTASTMALMDSSPQTYEPVNETTSPIAHFRGTIVRTLYIVLLLCVLGICICYTIPYKGASLQFVHERGPAAALSLIAAVYIFMSGVSAILFAIYLIRNGTRTTTIIPCIGTWWYKLYTVVFIVAVIGLIVTSGIYTRRTACGKLTLFPAVYDQQACRGVPVHADDQVGAMGFLLKNPELTPQTWLVPLTNGWCAGDLVDKIIPFMPVGGS